MEDCALQYRSWRRGLWTLIPRDKHYHERVRQSPLVDPNPNPNPNPNPDQVLAVLPQLVDALFKLMNDIGNEEVVQTLDNL